MLLCALLLIIGTSITAQTPAATQTSPAVVTPPPAMQVEGLPPIPKKLAERVNRYISSRAARLQSWHPARREMLISTRFADTAQIHLVEMPGGTRRQLTFFSNRVDSAWFEPREGKYFVFTMDEAGGEAFHLHRFDLDTGEITQLTSGDDSVYSIFWLQRGERLVYSSTTHDAQHSDFYLLDPLNPKQARHLVRVSGLGWDVLDVSKDDKQVLINQYISAEESALHLLELPGGTLTQITHAPRGEKIAYWSAKFSTDGKQVYLTSDQGSEYSRIVTLDLTTKRIEGLQPQQAHKGAVDALTVSKDGHWLAYITNEEGVGKLHVHDLRMRREARVPELPVGVISNLEWRDDSELGFNLETTRYPMDVYSFSVEKGKIERWTFSETGGVATDKLPDAQLIRWQSFDRTISGFLYRPPARFTGKRPVLIDIHGGPQLQARPYYSGRYNYYSNELGMAVIYPNVRGSWGFGKTFLTLDDGARRVNCLKDLRALLDWIGTQPDLDSSKVVLRGDSYGGFLALALAVTDSSRLRGVIAVSPITSIASLIRGADAGVQPYLRIEYGDERDLEQLRAMEAISPIANVNRISVPLLLGAGKNDIRVPPSEAEKMARAAQSRQLPVWYFYAADEGHIFNRKPNRDYLFYATALFIQQFVTG
ncbi:MAG: S9 family peptidase [Pyrinomonadaceae bacterium]|nr:S9 family peptidase [Pyrinomonadaceae bacterium]